MNLIGTLDIQIDDLGIKAILIFKKDETKDVWNIDTMYKAILAKGFAFPISKPQLDKNIQTWAKMPKDEFSIQIASGPPPEATVHETINWIDAPIPESLLDKSEELFASAPLPEITNHIVEKIKVEKIVKQKGKFPFMQGKEEKITSWETVEKDIKVEINPTIIFKAFVNRDESIAKIIPGRPGKPGKNVFNKLVAPEKLKKVDLYCGNNVTKIRSELRAAKQGLLRCGENWADIIPFQMQALNIYKDVETHLCMLDFDPNHNVNQLPDIETIYKKAEEIGFKRLSLLPKTELEKILRNAIENNIPIDGKALNLQRDAYIQIFTTPDKSSVLLNLAKAGGNGKELDLKDIGREINNLSYKNLNKEKIKNDILAFYKGPERELLNYILIGGKPAVRGQDGKLDFKCSFLDNNEAKEFLLKLKNDPQRIKLKSETKFPISNIEAIARVSKNQKIAEILPPSFGQPGVDIQGNEIPPIRGNDPDITIYENAILSKNEILSALDGILETGKNGETTLIRIRETQDAKVEIKISESRIKAFLTLHPLKGIGRSITIEDIQSELQNLGIVKITKQDQFQAFIDKAQRGEPVKDEVIAEGRPPMHGSGKRLLFHVKIISSNTIELGNQNTTNTTALSVKKDSIIAEIFPPAIPPRDGWDITGAVIPADEGVSIELHAGKNIKTITENDGSIKFIADIDGEVIYDGKTIEINNQQVIKGDIHPGKADISTNSSLLIEGSILAGAKVFSKGNITINNNIEAAIVSSDGSIQVHKDIIGNKRTILRAKNDIYFNNADNAMILAVSNITIKSRCINSTLKCNGQIKFESAKGLLAGGVIKAKKGMELIDLGAANKIKTYLSFGQDYLIKDQIEVEENEIKKLNVQIDTYDKQMKILESHDQKDKEKLFQIRKAKRLAIKTIEIRNGKLFMLREKFEEHFPSEIIIHGKIFPGTIIESHGRVFEIQILKEKVIIYFNTQNGKIEDKPFV